MGFDSISEGLLTSGERYGRKKAAVDEEARNALQSLTNRASHLLSRPRGKINVVWYSDIRRAGCCNLVGLDENATSSHYMCGSVQASLDSHLNPTNWQMVLAAVSRPPSLSERFAPNRSQVT